MSFTLEAPEFFPKRNHKDSFPCGLQRREPVGTHRNTMQIHDCMRYWKVRVGFFFFFSLRFARRIQRGACSLAVCGALPQSVFFCIFMEPAPSARG